jgi:hypothetical protein
VILCVRRFPEDGTLVPKHVGFGIYRELCGIICSLWCVRLTTLPSSCDLVMKSGNLNFLESSGPLQACNGTATTLLLPLIYEYSLFYCIKCIVWQEHKIRKSFTRF